jgi:hypothetical protein
VRKPTRIPAGARRRSGQFPGEELKKACNKLYYGDENISEPPGKTSMFRAVCVVGAVLVVPEPGGDPVIRVGGTYTIPTDDPEQVRAIADYLRDLADALDREVAD